MNGPGDHRGDLFDDESPDAATPTASGRSGLDVTPRQHTPGSGPPAGTRKVLAVGAIVLLVGALGVVLFNGLNDAALFYYNVDEALERRDELGDDRFRMQGNVVEGSIAETDEGIEFVLAFGDGETRVRHRGDPPELFSPTIPVIIEGSFGDGAFDSDEILIRHDSTYTEEHDERLREAEEDVEARRERAG